MADRLLGDIVEDGLKKIHVDKIATALSSITKKPCGCNKRKEALNEMHQRIKNRLGS